MELLVEVAEQWYERALEYRGKCRLRFRHARLMMWLALFRAAYEVTDVQKIRR